VQVWGKLTKTMASMTTPRYHSIQNILK